MFITAYRRRTTVTTVTVLDSGGSAVTFAAGDVMLVKIGRPSETPVLELKSGTPSANGSSVTAANPTTLTLNQKDLSFSPGVYELEAWICDDSTNQVLEGQKGVFVLHRTMAGELCESSSSSQSNTTSSLSVSTSSVSSISTLTSSASSSTSTLTSSASSASSPSTSLLMSTTTQSSASSTSTMVSTQSSSSFG